MIRILLKVEFVDGVTRLDCMKKADDYKVGRCHGNTSLGYRQILSVLAGFDFIKKNKKHPKWQ